MTTPNDDLFRDSFSMRGLSQAPPSHAPSRAPSRAPSFVPTRPSSPFFSTAPAAFSSSPPPVAFVTASHAPSPMPSHLPAPRTPRSLMAPESARPAEEVGLVGAMRDFRARGRDVEAVITRTARKLDAAARASLHLAAGFESLERFVRQALGADSLLRALVTRAPRAGKARAAPRPPSRKGRATGSFTRACAFVGELRELEAELLRALEEGMAVLAHIEREELFRDASCGSYFEFLERAIRPNAKLGGGLLALIEEQRATRVPPAPVEAPIAPWDEPEEAPRRSAVAWTFSEAPSAAAAEALPHSLPPLSALPLERKPARTRKPAKMRLAIAVSAAGAVAAGSLASVGVAERAHALSASMSRGDAGTDGPLTSVTSGAAESRDSHASCDSQESPASHETHEAKSELARPLVPVRHAMGAAARSTPPRSSPPQGRSLPSRTAAPAASPERAAEAAVTASPLTVPTVGPLAAQPPPLSNTTAVDRVRERAGANPGPFALKLGDPSAEAPELSSLTATPRGSRTGATWESAKAPAVGEGFVGKSSGLSPTAGYDRLRERAAKEARAVKLRLRSQPLDPPDVPSMTETPPGTRTGATFSVKPPPVVEGPSVR